LENGYRVAATSRNVQGLKEGIGVINTKRFLPLVVDLHSQDSINQSIQETNTVFGGIDSRY
jgi:hypothetical protein